MSNRTSPDHLALLNPPSLTLEGQVLPMTVGAGGPVPLTVQVQDMFNNQVTYFTTSLGAWIEGDPTLQLDMNPPITNGIANLVCTFTEVGSSQGFEILVPFLEPR